ncbi:MAG: hypothetical protein HQK49_22895 [Oligoflexia bacterium]|nr:hypothetical protein [Oligoflexia bacterium]
MQIAKRLNLLMLFLLFSGVSVLATYSHKAEGNSQVTDCSSAEKITTSIAATIDELFYHPAHELKYTTPPSISLDCRGT